MRLIVRSLLLLLLVACGSKVVLNPQKTGITTVRFHDQNRDRPLITEVWYPIEDHLPAQKLDGIWVRCPEVRDAPLKTSSKKYPLIVMSHGNGSERTHNAWLAEILAANGYIVASVDHHGNTWNNTKPEEVLKIWERPKDVSFVVDELLKEPRFGPHIDMKKIGFIGYSLGGQTGVWIAGGEISYFEMPLLKTIPPDQIPSGVTEEVLSTIDFSPIKGSYRDPRISAAFLMAPALGYLFDPASLQSISIPVYIVASEGDVTVPIEKSAKILASKIKKGALLLIRGSANHYVFLNEVTRGGKMLVDKKIAFDPPDVDRAKIHREIAQSAVEFFRESLR